MGGHHREFAWDAGRISLDLAQDEAIMRDPLASSGALADWLAESPLGVLVLSVSSHEMEAAIALRQAVRLAAERVFRGSGIPREAVATLNSVAQKPDLALQLEDGLAVWQADASVDAALSTIARDAIDLFGSAHRQRIRRCKNPECQLWFLDLSRPGQRAWCSMARCGNVAKTRSYRQRRQS